MTVGLLADAVPVNDAVAEDIETVICTITTDPAYQTFAPSASAAMWLRDDENPTVWVDSQIGTNGATINHIAEGSGTATKKFYVSRTGSTTSALNENFSLGGTATRVSDYAVTTSPTLTFDTGTGTGTLTIPAGSLRASIGTMKAL